MREGADVILCVSIPGNFFFTIILWLWRKCNHQFLVKRFSFCDTLIFLLLFTFHLDIRAIFLMHSNDHGLNKIEIGKKILFKKKKILI